jgi:hypothetical protein
MTNLTSLSKGPWVPGFHSLSLLLPFPTSWTGNCQGPLLGVCSTVAEAKKDTMSAPHHSAPHQHTQRQQLHERSHSRSDHSALPAAAISRMDSRGSNEEQLMGTLCTCTATSGQLAWQQWPCTVFGCWFDYSRALTISKTEQLLYYSKHMNARAAGSLEIMCLCTVGVAVSCWCHQGAELLALRHPDRPTGSRTVLPQIDVYGACPLLTQK